MPFTGRGRRAASPFESSRPPRSQHPLWGRRVPVLHRARTGVPYPSPSPLPWLARPRGCFTPSRLLPRWSTRPRPTLGCRAPRWRANSAPSLSCPWTRASGAARRATLRGASVLSPLQFRLSSGPSQPPLSLRPRPVRCPPRLRLSARPPAAGPRLRQVPSHTVGSGRRSAGAPPVAGPPRDDSRAGSRRCFRLPHFAFPPRLSSWPRSLPLFPLCRPHLFCLLAPIGWWVPLTPCPILLSLAASPCSLRPSRRVALSRMSGSGRHRTRSASPLPLALCL